MTFLFTITKTGNYSQEELAQITTVLQRGGEIVQNVYNFERDISVNVVFQNMEDLQVKRISIM